MMEGPTVPEKDLFRRKVCMIRGRYFNADCATHAIAIYQQDNARQCLQGYDVLPWTARSPDLSPACLDAQKLQRYRRINCADAKDMAGSSHRGS
ncbi:hypothetical protein TNCV_4754841 [Trichonephila clavipes]|nr:hypothetical protein TNCV_4754841 [Trichonephila clavipes]